MTGIAATAGFAIVQTSRTLCARNSVSSRVIVPTARKTAEVRFGASSSCQPPLDAANEVKKAGVQMKEQVASDAEIVADQSKDVAGKVAENIAEKAKQTAQDAWNVAKETARKVKDEVSEKAEEAAGAVKENVNAAKRKMK